MSIGLVLRHTYQETCEVCDKLSAFIRKSTKSFLRVCESLAYARAANFLVTQGIHEEAKQLMLERKNIK